MRDCLILLLVSLFCASAAAPSVTWQVDGDFTMCSSQTSICAWDSTKESYKGFQYFYAIGISPCTCVVWPNPPVVYEYIQSGTRNYDSTGVFTSSSRPVDCSATNDFELDCVKAAYPYGAVYETTLSSLTFTSKLSVFDYIGGVVYPVVQVSSATNAWKIQITSYGTVYVWNGSSFYSTAASIGYVQDAAIGNDG